MPRTTLDVAGRRLLATAAGTLLLAGCGSGGTEPDPPPTGGTSTGALATGGPSASDPASDAMPTSDAELPDVCSDWAAAPEMDEPIVADTFVGNAVWEKVDGYLWFEASWRNVTDLVAVNVSADVRILFDGEDITGQLPRPRRMAPYTPFTIDVMLPQDVAQDRDEWYGTGEVRLDMPPSPRWSESSGGRTGLEAEPHVDAWCVPKDGLTG